MIHRLVSRREALRELAAAGAFFSFGCALSQGPGRNGRITARPRSSAGPPVAGLTALGLGRERDGFLYAPPAAATEPVPVVVLLHGAGGSARGILSRMSAYTDSARCVFVVPDSRGQTWDAIHGDYGPDVSFIDRALSLAFSRFGADPDRLVVSGFSDGASYALALGLVNGDLFRHVVAFSPGMVPAGSRTGKPRIFITHGDSDPILPFEVTSRRIVSDLMGAGYEVTLRQFSGGHTIPTDLAREGYDWAVR